MKALYDKRTSLALDAESKYLLDRYYRDFVHAGVQLSDADATTLRAVNSEEAMLQTDFQEKLLADTNASAVVVDSVAELAGLPAADTVANARGEAEGIQKLIGASFKLEPWDWQYYSEQVRKADYDFDETEVKQYFELDRVLRDGVFFAANQLYGIAFKERKDIPVYNPDVRVFDVTDADGTPLAIFFFDPFSRPNKESVPWTGRFADQNDLLGTRPVVYNLESFAKPAPGQPALVSLADVTSMFHEFGHALHAMFSKVKYRSSGGSPNDWSEFPSQFNEHWALEPAVFTNYAKHYKTGQPMPQVLVEKINRSRTFGQGYATTELVAAALLDMAWHTLTASDVVADVDKFEHAALQRFNIDVPEVPARYHTTYFSHIWTNGYAAGYYAYLWSEVLDDDAYYWFRENGGMTHANRDRFRSTILARRGMDDPASMYRVFRGRDPIVEPLHLAEEFRGARQSGLAEPKPPSERIPAHALSSGGVQSDWPCVSSGMEQNRIAGAWLLPR